MSENPSQTAVYRLKNPAMAPTSRTAVWVDHHRPVQAVGSSSKGHQPAQQQRQHPFPRASPVIDLNEACELVMALEILALVVTLLFHLISPHLCCFI
jgi:hypothetical protein